MANKRPAWKIPAVINPPNRRCIQINVPDDPQHLSIFWGVLRSLSDWQRWEREGTKSGTLVAQVWRDVVYSIEWEDSCMSCCPSVTNQYYDEDGVLQQSTDGGVTYTPALDDPRFNSPLLPPLPLDPSDELRCAAANNVVGYVKSQADQLIADSAAWGNLTGLVAALVALLFLLLEIGSGGALTLLLIPLAAALLQAGASAFEAALTTEVWNEFLCIVYCSTPADAEYTMSDWGTIKGRASSFSGIAGIFLHDTINVLGVAGLINASRSEVSYDGDCSECECSDEWWYEFDFRTSAYSQYFSIANDDGTYQAGVGYKVVLSDGYEVRVNGNFGFDIQLVGWILEHNGTDLTNFNRSVTTNNNGFANLDTNSTPVIDGSGLYASANPPLGAITDNGVGAYFRGAGDSGHSNVRLVRLVLHGRGVNPFGFDNYVYDSSNP